MNASYSPRMEIDASMERAAVDEAVQGFPSMGAYAAAARLRWLPLPGGGGAFMLRWDPPLPPGLTDAWEFQNAVVRAYRRRAGEPPPAGGCAPT